MSTTIPAPDPVATLKQVARHLVAAEGAALQAAATVPDVGDIAVGAALLTSQVLRMLPDGEHIDDDGDGVSEAAGGVGAAAWLREAEQLARAHPIEAYPPEASAFVADLCDLIAQARS